MLKALLTATTLTLAAALPAAAADAPEDPLAAWEADRTAVLDAAGLDPDVFLWAARPVVVFADTPRDPAFLEQMEELAEELDRLVERDVVVIADTDPDARSELRRALRPRGFMLALIGKDGEVELRKPFPWTVRELSRSIDKMPMRQREMRGD